jgi:phenylacetate-CoA ligase
VVQGHPSTLFAFARWLHKSGRDGRGLFEIFVSTGEMISPAQRHLIEDRLGVRVADRYGACEFGVMAQELEQGPKGELLVSDSLVRPELFEPDETGEGELVFTGLRNPAMPLIRYRMGDLGRLEERERGWWLSSLTGRVHDQVEIDGNIYPTHYIQDIFDRCGPITDFQIVAREGRAREFRLVAEEGAWEGIRTAVSANFPSVAARRITPEELVFVGERGKFSYLLREAP